MSRERVTREYLEKRDELWANASRLQHALEMYEEDGETDCWINEAQKCLGECATFIAAVKGVMEADRRRADGLERDVATAQTRLAATLDRLEAVEKERAEAAFIEGIVKGNGDASKYAGASIYHDAWAESDAASGDPARWTVWLPRKEG